MAKKYWLMKSEPDVYSIDHLERDSTTLWTGVRNYQARNFMMNEMNVGDEVLFYHSNAEPPGVAGVAVISQKAQADPTAQDKKSDYYDPKASHDHPIWFCVEVKFRKKLKRLVELSEIRAEKALQKMPLLQKGQRLSIQPVLAAEFQHILKMAQQ
jgi:predicted RNA-binding protein with PUA-like domain